MRRVILCLAVVLALPLLNAFASATEEQELPTLEVISRFTVAAPEDSFGLTDLRWASRDSVYLADLNGGVTERRLTEGLPVVRRLVPSPRRIGMFEIRRIGITDKWIVISNLAQIAWKQVESTAAVGDGWHVAKQRGFFHDFDIQGDEVVMLGWPPGPGTQGLERGGVVWRADLSKGLDTWDVVHESKEVAADLERIRTEFSLGSIRFLRRGGWMVAPSFLPGVLQLSASGTVKSSWSPQVLWGEERTWAEGQRDPSKFLRFASATKTIDLVLALPEGPAIVVREPKGRKARYRLGVLGPEIQWYEIPMPAVSTTAHLRGDVDAKGRIVLADALRVPLRSARVASSEVVVLRLPR